MGKGGGGRKKKWKNKNFILNRLGRGSFLSRRHGIRYFALLLKLNDRRFAGFLTFIRPVVQWITQQWSFAPVLSPWNVRFSLVLGKYSYALGQQPSWHVPSCFRQISYASPLHMCKNLSERGLFTTYHTPYQTNSPPVTPHTKPHRTIQCCTISHHTPRRSRMHHVSHHTIPESK